MRNTGTSNGVAHGRETVRALMRKSEMGTEVAAAQNLRRLAAEAEVLEDMREQERAREAYHDLAAGALARAQLLTH